MGEYNDPVDYPQAMGNLLEALAHYLYDHYDYDKHNIDWDDPRHPKDCIGDMPEPWNTAGKRKREYWLDEADNLLKHFARLYQEM